MKFRSTTVVEAHKASDLLRQFFDDPDDLPDGFKFGALIFGRTYVELSVAPEYSSGRANQEDWVIRFEDGTMDAMSAEDFAKAFRPIR